MNTINQSRPPAPSLSRQSDELSAEPNLARTPLQVLMDDANAGGDQHNGAGTPAANDLRDPANFAFPGPMTSLLSEPLLSNPFALAQIAGGQPLSVNAGQQAQPSSYKVKSGDTLTGIAAAHNMSLDELIALNPQIRNPDLIHPGDQITVSSQRHGNGNTQASTHTVVGGDTLSGIAARNGVSVSALLAANPQISNPDLIHPGDVINLPSGTENPGGPGGPTGPAETPAPDNPPGGPAAGGDFDYDMISGVAGNQNITPEFINEVEAMAERLGTRPEYLMAVMSFESAGSFDPAIENPLSGATGLIQFIPSTARGLGTSTNELSRMSPLEQLEFVEKYFDQPHFAGKLGSVEGLYSAVLSGQAKPNPDDTLPNFVRGHQNYTQNAPLDINGDGRITSGEASSEVVSRLYGGVPAVQQQLIDAGAVPANQQSGFADGDFGPDTQSALINFQNANGLEPTGYLNDETGRLLFNLDGAQSDSGNGGTTTGAVDLELNNDIHERSTPARQSITSPVIGDFTITEGFMARGGPHSSKSARQAIFSDNPTVAENVPAGVYNLGIDYVTADGRIDSWFNGEVIGTDYSSTGYGNRLIMKSDVMFEYNGQSYPVFAHYAHADSFNVSVGDRITAGQDIGDQGSTGGSTGDHVDFHTWIEVNGQRITISPNLLAGG
ncbi:MAG: LysM peptidoglycan-binding domain-containing protein [Gammaproteobacteria bacterium]|nr:LysM peptidoglycan-binding domain-containing protein [Gammaproteobacteria bacterium]